MALLIDTSVFIALERAGKDPADLLERFGEQEVSLAAITASELLHGVHRTVDCFRLQPSARGCH